MRFKRTGKGILQTQDGSFTIIPHGRPGEGKRWFVYFKDEDDPVSPLGYLSLREARNAVEFYTKDNPPQ